MFGNEVLQWTFWYITTLYYILASTQILVQNYRHFRSVITININDYWYSTDSVYSDVCPNGHPSECVSNDAALESCSGSGWKIVCHNQVCTCESEHGKHNYVYVLYTSHQPSAYHIQIDQYVIVSQREFKRLSEWNHQLFP